MKVKKSKDKRIKLKIERKQILKLFLEKMSPEFLRFSFQHFWRFSTKLGIRLSHTPHLSLASVLWCNEEFHKVKYEDQMCLSWPN